MATVLVSFLTLVGGAVVSGVLTYVGTRRKLVLDYDADLRQRRISVYTDLWSRLEPLAKYAADASFSEAEAKKLAESLRAWYFDKGGLFLSTAARGDCFALQDVLRHLTTGGWGWEAPDRQNLTPAAREHLRTYGSRLRTSLTRDVGTRTRPRMQGDSEPVDRRLAGLFEREIDKKRLRLEFRPRILGGTRRLSIKTIDATGERRIDVREWTPERLTIRAVLDDPDGNWRERVLLMEGGQLVEGPALDEQDPAQPALWRRISPADG
jgi:hypothetical protein